MPAVSHLPAEELRRRWRRWRGCADAAEKTRWHAVWLLSRPGSPLSCEAAAPLVGLSDTQVRVVLKRWNADGPAGLADRRRANGRAGNLTPAQQAGLFEALRGEPPDGGLWSGPKVAAYARGRFGVAAHPATGWRWLRALGFRLRVPRPRHPGAADHAARGRWLRGAGDAGRRLAPGGAG